MFIPNIFDMVNT